MQRKNRGPNLREAREKKTQTSLRDAMSGAGEAMEEPEDGEQRGG